MSVLHVYRNGTFEQLALVHPASMGYSNESETVNLPTTPFLGQIYEYIGTGTNWALTAASGYYIRLLTTESVSGGVISSTSEYDCVMLIFAGSLSGHNTWLVKSSVGILEVV